ncbi:hypothetical protein DSM112329_00147 [Paraconexibacter sp. AEG42_29]|uniref:Class F sortase n=1 Tax=Paraconexibacter sp. AEG42_29 TaxID=2997339 RepID=A0AAU7APP0_9ACTN
MRRTLRSLLAATVIGLAAAPAASAAEPPNQNDPCSSNARNTCGTTGVGDYKTYKFGPRWFGDYRGAIPGVTGASFCIDLRFWYPAKSYGYEKRSLSAGLKNRDGDTVTVGNLRRMAYALWSDGRTQSKTSQGAVMLYVHRLMGDGAPGEIDPKAVSPAVAAAFTRITREATKYAGPYKLDLKAPDKLVAGKADKLTARVLAASGAAVPGVTLKLSGSGADGLAKTANTGSGGSVDIPVTADDAAGGLKVTVTTEDLPSTLPVMYVPTKGPAARSGQRLVVPDSQTLTARAAVTVQAQPTVRTQVSSATLEPGDAVSDTVIVEGLQGRTATVNAMLYGPFPSVDKIVCTTPPVWTGTVTATGDGSYVTEPVVLTQPGYYTYRESLVATDTVAGVETACAEASETTVVRGRPAIRTQISAAETKPGAQITDTAVVSGLGTLSAPVQVELWGPYDALADMTCTGTPVHTSTFTANGDGSYVTEPVTLPRAGYYTYREAILETPAYAGVQTECGEATETTFAKAAPAVTTVVSSAVVKPGASIFDRVKVTGAGQTPLKIEVDLYGPFASRAAMRCTGTPLSRTTLETPGDGTFSSAKVKVANAGFYTYRERIKGTALITATQTECGEEAETSLAAPLILTGRGDRTTGHGGLPARKAQTASAVTPTRVSVARLGVSAPVAAVDIDMATGALDVPKNIQRVGWWRDGAAPGSTAGTVLLAGHVDSARDGGGAFYALKGARPGDVVKVTSDDGRTRSYRVTSRKSVRKNALPASIFTRKGPKRLVLVTCGGPFLQDVGHYRDNVIVTARPV